MSNEQSSPWASGDGFDTPQPDHKSQYGDRGDPPPTLDLPVSQPPASNYSNPSFTPRPNEPSGWSEPQQFGTFAPPSNSLAPQANTGPAAQFGQRLPYGYGAPLLPEHPNATLVLALGIVGLFTNFILLPFVSPIAWYLGAKARREMARFPGVYRDSGKLTAGYALGVIGTLLAATFIGLFVLLMVMAVTLW